MINKLRVNSIFYSIQGEGPWAGRPATFVRLSGCNLSCPLCDTVHKPFKEMTIDEIMLKLSTIKWQRFLRPLVVITGGEPLMQDLSELLPILASEGYEIQLETNGTVCSKENLEAIISSNAMVVCSPKTDKISKELQKVILAYKYVCKAVDMQADGLPIKCLDHPVKACVFRPPEKTFVYLQPADEKDEEKNKSNVRAIVDSCLTNGYNISCQLHKIIGVE